MIEADALLYLAESARDLMAHRRASGKGNDPTRAEVRYLWDKVDTVHLQIWWTHVPSVVAKSFLWDTVSVPAASTSQARSVATSAAAHVGFDLSDEPASPLKWRKAADVPLFTIHPQRYRELNPLGKPMAQAAQRGSQYGFTQETMQEAGDVFIRAQMEDLPRSSLRSRVVGDPRRSMGEATQLAMFFTDYCKRGRNIFHFPRHLTDLFSRTDVTDIPLEAINLPYASLYLSFGAQPGLEVEPGWVADGAYVAVLGDKQLIQFAMTAVPLDPDRYARWLEHPEPVYVQAIEEDRLKMGVGEAVDFVHADKLAELRAQIGGLGVQMPEGVVDVSGQYASAELKHLAQRHEAWSKLLRLVVNAMAYLSAYPDDIEQRWPTDTPQRLIHQTQDGKYKKRRDAESALAQLGYTQIHYCGKSFTHIAGNDADGTDGERQRTATWVRGHWIRQAYGEGRALRRLQWRMPFLRNAKNDSSAEPRGHIYQID